MPQSQWDRPVRSDWLLLGAVLVLGARIVAVFLDPGWTKHALELLLTMTVGVILSVLLHGGAFTARRVIVIPIMAVVGQRSLR